MSIWTNRSIVVAISGLFIASSALFAADLTLVGVVAILLGCGGVAHAAFAGSRLKPDGLLARPIDGRLLAGSMAVALVFFVLGGEGHFLYANADWLSRDAVLADLTRPGPLPTYLFDGREYVLRAPLGMYMIPAFAGRMLGLTAAHMALLCQNALATGGMLYLFASMARGWAAFVIALFVFFGGLNVLPWLPDLISARARGAVAELPIYMENWSPFFAYSSHVTQIFYVPNHMTPGWFLAILALLRGRGEISIGLMGALVGPMMFWSPLAVAVAPVLLIYLALRSSPRDVLSAGTLLGAASAALFLPIAAYLVSAADTIPNEWMIARSGFALGYVVFMAMEIPHAAVVASQWRMLAPSDRGVFALCVALLLVIPVYAFGPYNDFAMRASIAPLAVLAFAFADVVTRLDPERQRLARAAAIVIVAIGAFSPVTLITGAFTRARFAISDCNFLTTWYEIDHSAMSTNYLATLDRAPMWFIRHDPARHPLEVEPRACWPDHPEPDQIHQHP